MPTYGIDKNDKYIEVESVKRTQLLKYYGDFGYNNAIAKHKSTMSYVAQLADGYRLFALNDDYGDPDCGFSDELMNWVKQKRTMQKRRSIHYSNDTSPSCAAVAYICGCCKG